MNKEGFKQPENIESVRNAFASNPSEILPDGEEKQSETIESILSSIMTAGKKGSGAFNSH